MLSSADKTNLLYAVSIGPLSQALLPADGGSNGLLQHRDGCRL